MEKVYLIESDINNVLTYKIGRTKRKVSDRLKELNTGNAGKLTIISEYESNNSSIIETTLHKIFISNKISNEWFYNITKEDFLQHCKQIDDNIIYLRSSGNTFI